ncbi:MAG: hypothetical protein ACLTTW_07740 [Coprobacter sp.]
MPSSHVSTCAYELFSQAETEASNSSAIILTYQNRTRNRNSTCCLRRWRNDHPEVFSNTSVQIKNIRQSIEIDLIQRDKNFIQKNYAKWEQVCEKLTDQLLNMAETEADIEKIARTLKIIREIMNPTNSNNPTTNVATSQINILRLELEKQSLLPE